jgi:nucleotide-binding universal stress UspA family protein
MYEIVVGVDGSEASHRALAWALDAASSRGDTVVVLMHGYRSGATRDPFAYSYAYLPPTAVTSLVEQERTWQEQQETRARQHSETLLEEALKAVGGVPEGVVIKKMSMAQDPTQALLKHSGDTDLLVVGSRGRGGFKGLLLGSVSQQCVHHARCPVVVVR